MKGQPITILIAEDDVDDRDMTMEAFRTSKLRNGVQFVEDGDAVLDYLYGRAPYEDAVLPGLILLDLNMPKRGGLETLSAIKAEPRLQAIPVIILTTSKSEEDIVRSYAGGASSFITKPVTFDALVKVVGTFGEYWLQVVALPVGARS